MHRPTIDPNMPAAPRGAREDDAAWLSRLVWEYASQRLIRDAPALLLALTIVEIMRRTGRCDVSLSVLARLTCQSVRTIQGKLNDLERAGVIRRREVFEGQLRRPSEIRFRVSA